jgi:hypothetical protein
MTHTCMMNSQMSWSEILSRVHSIVLSEDRRELALWMSHHTMTYWSVLVYMIPKQARRLVGVNHSSSQTAAALRLDAPIHWKCIHGTSGGSFLIEQDPRTPCGNIGKLPHRAGYAWLHLHSTALMLRDNKQYIAGLHRARIIQNTSSLIWYASKQWSSNACTTRYRLVS